MYTRQKCGCQPNERRQIVVELMMDCSGCSEQMGEDPSFTPNCAGCSGGFSFALINYKGKKYLIPISRWYEVYPPAFVGDRECSFFIKEGNSLYAYNGIAGNSPLQLKYEGLKQFIKYSIPFSLGLNGVIWYNPGG